jgi:hypothetical protein
MITLEQAKLLKVGQTIYQIDEYNADGTPRRWKVNGAVKLWKRSPGRIQIPLKHGLYAFGYLDEYNLDIFTLTEGIRKP